VRPTFQADADFNQKIVLGLRRRERAVGARSGIIGVPDLGVLHKAADLGRILISHDRKTMPSHFSLELRGGPRGTRADQGVCPTFGDESQAREWMRGRRAYPSKRLARNAPA
jgi:hypothetical protein